MMIIKMMMMVVVVVVVIMIMTTIIEAITFFTNSTVSLRLSGCRNTCIVNFTNASCVSLLPDASWRNFDACAAISLSFNIV